MYLEFVSENTKLINNLRKLQWDNSTPDYYITLPTGETFTEEFYKTVIMINNVTINGYQLYTSQPENSEEQKFLEFFIANAYQSEEFIWNQKGLMQSYYKEGLPWQRGSLIDGKYKDTNKIAILSSCVGDSVIASSLMNIQKDYIMLWLGQEQQNFISNQLFNTGWSKQVDTPSNPYIFRNVIGSNQPVDIPNPHRFVFGPSTWLAMTTDILKWNRTQNKRIFQSYIKTGKELWKQVGDNLYINHGLLDKVPNKHIIPIRKLIMPNYSPPPPNGILEYTYHNATETLDTIDELLKKASKNKKDYYTYINESARYIKEFYCNKDGTCPFIDPKVVVE